MDTIPFEIFSIILKNIGNIKNLVSVNKYFHEFSQSWILENCYIKWYSGNAESAKKLIVYDLKQLESYSGITKANILNTNSGDINSTNLTSLEIDYLDVECNKLNLPNLKKLCVNDALMCGFSKKYFNEGLEYLEIKEICKNNFPHLPNSLISLRIGSMKLNFDFVVFPVGLIELELTITDISTIGDSMKQLLNLKKLKLSNFRHSISNCLPDSLEILDLGDEYCYQIFKLPKYLKELHIGLPRNEESHELPNLIKLTIEFLPEKSWCNKFNFSKLEELCIKSGGTNFTLPSLKKLICHPKFYIPATIKIDTYETVSCLRYLSLSKRWKIIRFDNFCAIESHDSFKERNEYNKNIDRARYGEDFGRSTTHSFKTQDELTDKDLIDKAPNYFDMYFGKINTRTKTMYRKYPVNNEITKHTYATLKYKLTNYANGFLIDILSKFSCFITGFYIVELMHSDIVSDTIDIYCLFDLENLKLYVCNKYNAIEVCYNYFYIKSINHLIKIRDAEEQRLFSFENVIINIVENELKIYNNIPVCYNFLTTNRCYIKEYTDPKYINNKCHFLSILSILYKNDVNLLLTNGIISLLSDIFKNYSYPEYNFSYRDICNKYHGHPEFINILKTELLLNYSYIYE